MAKGYYLNEKQNKGLDRVLRRRPNDRRSQVAPRRPRRKGGGSSGESTYGGWLYDTVPAAVKPTGVPGSSLAGSPATLDDCVQLMTGWNESSGNYDDMEVVGAMNWNLTAIRGSSSLPVWIDGRLRNKLVGETVKKYLEIATWQIAEMPNFETTPAGGESQIVFHYATENNGQVDGIPCVAAEP